MSHSLHKKALVIALFGLSSMGVAMADSFQTNVNNNNTLTINNKPIYDFVDTGSTKLDNDSNINVDVNLAEVFNVDEGTVATTFDSQLIKNNHVNIKDPSTASVDGSVNGNQGNTGVNVAAGAFNQQANDVALAVSKSGAPSDGGGEISLMFNQQPNNPHNPPGNGGGGHNGHEKEPVKAVVALTGYDQEISDPTIQIGTPFEDFNNNMKATLTGSVQNNVGNVGVNVAGGLANQQKNDLAIALDPSEVDLVYASSGGSQLLYDNSYDIDTGHHFPWLDPKKIALGSTAKIKDSVSGNTGNVGVNVTAGINNQQANGLAIANVDTATLALASAGGMQISQQNTLTSYLPLKNDASMSGSVYGNTGNIGVNLSAGIGNQQVNNLAIAVKN